MIDMLSIAGLRASNQVKLDARPDQVHKACEEGEHGACQEAHALAREQEAGCPGGGTREECSRPSSALALAAAPPLPSPQRCPCAGRSSALQATGAATSHGCTHVPTARVPAEAALSPSISLPHHAQETEGPQDELADLIACLENEGSSNTLGQQQPLFHKDSNCSSSSEKSQIPGPAAHAYASVAMTSTGKGGTAREGESQCDPELVAAMKLVESLLPKDAHGGCLSPCSHSSTQPGPDPAAVHPTHPDLPANSSSPSCQLQAVFPHAPAVAASAFAAHSILGDNSIPRVESSPDLAAPTHSSIHSRLGKGAASCPNLGPLLSSHDPHAGPKTPGSVPVPSPMSALLQSRPIVTTPAGAAAQPANTAAGPHVASLAPKAASMPGPLPARAVGSGPWPAAVHPLPSKPITGFAKTPALASAPSLAGPVGAPLPPRPRASSTGTEGDNALAAAATAAAAVVAAATSMPAMPGALWEGGMSLGQAGQSAAHGKRWGAKNLHKDQAYVDALLQRKKPPRLPQQRGPNTSPALHLPLSSLPGLDAHFYWIPGVNSPPTQLTAPLHMSQSMAMSAPLANAPHPGSTSSPLKRPSKIAIRGPGEGAGEARPMPKRPRHSSTSSFDTLPTSDSDSEGGSSWGGGRTKGSRGSNRGSRGRAAGSNGKRPYRRSDGGAQKKGSVARRSSTSTVNSKPGTPSRREPRPEGILGGIYDFVTQEHLKAQQGLSNPQMLLSRAHQVPPLPGAWQQRSQEWALKRTPSDSSLPSPDVSYTFGCPPHRAQPSSFPPMNLCSTGASPSQRACNSSYEWAPMGVPYVPPAVKESDDELGAVHSCDLAAFTDLGKSTSTEAATGAACGLPEDAWEAMFEGG